MLKTLTLATISCLIILNAPAASAQTPAQNPDFDFAVQLIERDLKPFVHSLTRPVTVFHWADRQTEMKITGTEPVALKDPRALQHAISWRKAVFKSGIKQSSAVGLGLYAAMDPLISSEYANSPTDWAMLAIDLDIGTRYLDIRNFGSYLPMSPTTAGFLKTLCPGFVTERSRAFAGQTVLEVDKGLLGSRAPLCHDAWVAAARKLKLGFIYYGWSSSSFAACPSKAPGAVVIMDAPLTTETVSIFVKDGPGGTDSAELEAYRQMQAVASQPQKSYGSGVENSVGAHRLKWNHFVGKTPSISKTESWMKDHLLGCGSKPEDRLIDETEFAPSYKTAREQLDKLAPQKP